MRLTIAHLSDLHISDKNDLLLKRTSSVATSIIGSSLEINEILILVTGDITFSAKTDQFVLADDFFKRIIENIKKESKNVSIFFVPGNHDCDFSKQNPIRDNLVNSVINDPSKFHPDFINVCCEPQLNYREFIKNYNRDNFDSSISLLFNSKTINFDKNTIRIDMFNSSWLSNQTEKPGSIYFPLDYLQINDNSHKEDLSIAMLHHKLNWFLPENARDFLALLESKYHFIFTGHEHTSLMTLKTRLEDKISTNLFEGGILQDDKKNSNFNFIMVDLEKSSYKLSKNEWKHDHYVTSQLTDGWEPLRASIHESEQQPKISNEFLEKINDPGAAFKHPRKSNVYIEDIYIPPDLLTITAKENIKDSLIFKPINSKNFVEGMSPINYSIILGASNSGKTKLCFYFFKLFHAKGIIPIYVEGNSIYSKTIDSFIKNVETKYKEQYSSIDIDIFRQLPMGKKAIIIDDFHCAHLNAKAKLILLSSICETFNVVICTANLTFAIEELTLDSSVTIPDIQTLQLSPFGHSLISQLISKWISLGQEDTISRNQLIRQHDDLQKTMNTILGKNLVPPYPIFLLTILQRCEDDIPHDIQSSAYGYYYEYLIIRALKDVKKRNEEIDAIYNYVTELANHFFEHKVRILTRDKLILFHEWYCREYRLTTSFNDIINNLLKAEILTETNDSYRFRYRYVYYFFVAKYLSNNMTKDTIRNRVSKMCERLYQDEFTNIIMFLTHLSKDPFILNNVLNSAKSIFSDETPQLFNEPIQEINNLLDTVPSRVLESRDVEKERKKVLEEKDKANPPNAEIIETFPECDYDLDAQIKDPESIEHFIMSMLTIEILGQILKNYYGSLKGEIKSQLGEETYLIALRATNRFYKKLILSKNQLIQKLTPLLTKVSDGGIVKRAEQKARELLFIICSFIPRMYINQISKSLAYDDLIETFNDIRAKNDSIAFGIIDLAIRIDCQKSFPIKEATELLHKIGNNILPSLLLKDLVINHLYLFPRKRSEKQSICDKLGISREIQKNISSK